MADNNNQSNTDVEDVDMNGPVIFTPPEKIWLENAQGQVVEVPRDPLRHFVEASSRRTQTELYYWYNVIPTDDVLSKCRILKDGAVVLYQDQPVPITNLSTIANIPALKSICLAWDAAHAAARADAKFTHDSNIEVGKKRPRDDAPAVRIKSPREWTGKCSSGDVASDLAVWMWEVKDYLQLTNTAPDRQAGIAASLLGGDARTQYLVKRTHAANADPEFKHTIEFFESTLKELYVPVAQKSHLWRRYLWDREWLEPHNAHFNILDQLTRYQDFLNKMQAQDLVPCSETRAQMLVTSFPQVIFDALKLTNENSYQGDYLRLKDQIELQADVLHQKYLDHWNAQQASSMVARANSPASKRVKAESTALRPATVATGDVRKAAGSSVASGSGIKPETSCHICHVIGHLTSACPFINTNVNNRRVGYDEKLCAMVRSDASRFLSDNKPNERFAAMGGKTVTAEVAPPPYKPAKSSKPFKFGHGKRK